MTEIFSPNPEQAAILETVREFAAEHVAPVMAELDARQDPADGFSWAIVEAADTLGIRTLTLSAANGGKGLDSLTTAMVIEELGKTDLGISVVLAQTLKLAQTLEAATNADQKARFIPVFRDDPRCVLAIAITEPDTASDYLVPHNSPDAPFRTTATKVDGGWRLNGMKHFISNGNVAGLYLVFAQTEPGKGLVDGATCFLVKKGTAGFTVGRVHDKLGERLANNAELHFKDCFVPDADVLGDVGQGFQVLVQFFPASNAYAGASVLGVAVHAYDIALAWARERVQGGKRLVEHDGIAADLAEMRMLIEAARAYIHKAAWLADHRAEAGWDPTFGALPKVFASQAAWRIVGRALEIYGARGFMRDTGVGLEKLLRDAAAFLHSDGANRTLLLKAAKFIV